MKKYFLIPIVLLLMSTLVFAGAGMDLGSAVNVTSTKLVGRVSVLGNSSASSENISYKMPENISYKMPKINKSHMLIMPNPVSQGESKLRECMLDTKRKHDGLSSFEVRYYCSQKLHIPIVPRELKTPKKVLDCILNLTINQNLSRSEAKAKCYSQYVNKSLNFENASSVEKLLNDSDAKRVIVKNLIHNKKAQVILQNPKIVRKIVNLNNLTKNKTELKSEVKVLMRTRTSRREFLSQLKSKKKLLMNKTVLSAFVPDHINLSKAEILNTTIKDNSSIVVKVRVRAKLFGVIPIPMTETIVNNGNVTVKKPFWSFLAKLS